MPASTISETKGRQRPAIIVGQHVAPDRRSRPRHALRPVTQTARHADWRGVGCGHILRINQAMGMFRRTGKGDGALHPLRAPPAATGGHGAGDRKETLPVGKFKPLGNDLPRALKGAVDAP